MGASGVIAPVAIQIALGERSEPALARLRGWLSRRSAVVLAVLFLIVGATLLADALPNLLG